jgi:hypothetical protein
VTYELTGVKEFVIPFVYNKPEHIICCWQRLISGPIPYYEKKWLEYGTDYKVSKIEEQDTGGTLYLLAAPPPEAQQLLIRRNTPMTQEVDLHNGARMTAELIEGVGDKTTMEIQELSAQAAKKDDLHELRKVMNDAIVAEETARKAADAELQKAIDAEAAERKEADRSLERDVNAEAEARKAADQELQAAVNAEVESRKAADKNLKEAIEAAEMAAEERMREAVSAEAAERREADDELRNVIDISIGENIQSYLEENEESLFKERGILPAGGAAGQILEKASDGDFDTVWADKPAGGGVNEEAVEGKADKVAGAGNGNFAGLDAEGNLTDSGKKAADFVQTAGAQTVAGVKTFTSIPVLPSGNPTAGSHAASKAYVDKKIMGVSGGGSSGGIGLVGADFIIGNAGAGHTLDDVDYLCNGTNDHAVINAAITDLPVEGGKIIILEGTYKLYGTITVNKNNVILQGMGESTELAIANSTNYIINLPANFCEINDLKLTCIYSSVLKLTGLSITGSNNAAAGNTITFNSKDEYSCGVKISGNNNLLLNNAILNKNTYKNCIGVDITGNGNVVKDNTISNSGAAGNNCIGVHFPSVTGGGSNTVTGNNISNSGGDNCTCYGVNIEGSYGNIIKDNTISNSNGIFTGRDCICYGISINGNGHVVKDNIIANTSGGGSSNTNRCYGIFIVSHCSNMAITSNTISNKRADGQNMSNTFALFSDLIQGSYNVFLYNNLLGVTSKNGAAYTTDGTSSSGLPGSSVSVAAFGTGGSCGFNIL